MSSATAFCGLSLFPARIFFVQRRGRREGKLLDSDPRLTADDGHRSAYAHMFSLVHLYRIPVTLFVYPSAISNADYALTWEQLLELKETGLFDIQSHSYWHPNFKEEKRRRLCISEGRTIKTIAVIPELNVPA
jgi:Polysaccharide deacetylase